MKLCNTGFINLNLRLNKISSFHDAASADKPAGLSVPLLEIARLKENG